MRLSIKQVKGRQQKQTQEEFVAEEVSSDLSSDEEVKKQAPRRTGTKPKNKRGIAESSITVKMSTEDSPFQLLSDGTLQGVSSG